MTLTVKDIMIDDGNLSALLSYDLVHRVEHITCVTWFLVLSLKTGWRVRFVVSARLCVVSTSYICK